MFEVNKYLKTILHNNDTIIVSCSGGPDSMCLLSLILAFKKEYNLNIICAHVNHHVREESDAEEKFVNNFCVINNIIFKKLDITNYNDNFHADARHQRYVFLDKLMKEEKAKYLMTAHHGDDLIETMLMRTQRGSNLRGYIGFKRDNIYHNYHIVRPLITLTKEEIKTYDDNNNIPYVIDKTNFNDEYTRNRYRKYVLPLLKKEDPNIHLKYLKLSEEMADYNEFVETYIINNKIVDDNILSLEKYNQESNFIKRKSIEYLISLVELDDDFPVTINNVLEIEKLLSSNKSNGQINLPNNYFGIKSYNQFTIEKMSTSQEFDTLFNNYFENDNWLIKTVVTTEEDSNYIFRLNTKEISLPIKIRTRKNGDNIKVKNLIGTKKIKDIFIDEKININKRSTWPLIVDAKNNVLGIPGIKKSQFCKDKTEKCDIIIKCKEK